MTTVLDLALAHYGVAREGLPGEWPAGYDDPAPCTPAWQEPITGVDRHLAARVAREFARNAEVTRGAVDDRDGRGDQPLVSLRSGLPDVPGAGDAVRLRGRQRRRLGALRRPGEGPAAGGLADARVRARLGAPAAPPVGHAVLLPGHRPVALRALPARRTSPRRSGAGCSTGATSPTSTRSARGWAGCRRIPSFDRSTLDLVDEAERAGRRPGRARRLRAARGAAALRVRGPRRAREPPQGDDACGASNLLGSSGKGHEYFLKHLLGTTENAVRAEESPPELRPREVRLARAGAGGQARPADDDRLPDDLQRAVLRCRAAGGDLV